jgi:PqqD family protein of HPr-rel-A system
MGSSDDWANHRLRRREGLQVRSIDGEVVILDSGRGTMHNLNPTASVIFEAIDGGLSAGEICDEVAARFDVAPEDAERDTRGLIRQLLDLGIVEAGPAC